MLAQGFFIIQFYLMYTGRRAAGLGNGAGEGQVSAMEQARGQILIMEQAMGQISAMEQARGQILIMEQAMGADLSNGACGGRSR